MRTYSLTLVCLSACLFSTPAWAADAQGRHPNIYLGIVKPRPISGDPAFQPRQVLRGLVNEVSKNLENSGIADVSEVYDDVSKPYLNWEPGRDWQKIPPGFTHYLIAEYTDSWDPPSAIKGIKWKVIWHEGGMVETATDGQKLTYFGSLRDPSYITTEGEFRVLSAPSQGQQDWPAQEASLAASEIARKFKILYPEVSGEYKYFIRCFGATEGAEIAARLASQLYNNLEGGSLKRARDVDMNVDDFTKMCNEESLHKQSDFIFKGRIDQPPASKVPLVVSFNIEDAYWDHRLSDPRWISYGSGAFGRISKQWSLSLDPTRQQREWEKFCIKPSETPELGEGVLRYLRAKVLRAPAPDNPHRC
jgi:hypothetical protein